MWEEMGHTGEGTVIAVLDSGVNYHHPDMKLSDGAKIRITENDAKCPDSEAGYGTYYSDKVPFAYSYSGYYEMDNHPTLMACMFRHCSRQRWRYRHHGCRAQCADSWPSGVRHGQQRIHG